MTKCIHCGELIFDKYIDDGPSHIFCYTNSNVDVDVYFDIIDKFADEPDGIWRTINGTPIFIKSGQSVSDAVKERFKDKDKPTKQGTEFAKTINSNSKENIVKLYKTNKSFRNAANVVTLFSSGISRELVMYENGRMSYDELNSAMKSETSGVESIIGESISMDEDSLNDGLKNLNSIISSTPERDMTLYRGITTSYIHNENEPETIINTDYKLTELSAFTTDKSQALLWSLAPTDRYGDSVVFKYSGPVRALSTSSFHSTGAPEKEFITNEKFKVKAYTTATRTHKNTRRTHSIFYVSLDKIIK